MIPVGALVAIPELQAEGVARLLALHGQQTRIRFLGTGAEKTQDLRQIVRYVLLPGTALRVRHEGQAVPATILPEGLRRDAATGLLVYRIATATQAAGWMREDAIDAVELPTDPLAQLRQAAFHELRPSHDPRLPGEPWGAPMYSARLHLLAWRDQAWSQSGGVPALAGARIQPLPHQLLTARQVLGDRQVRYLLADEVGLGKTIEAGLVMQSLLALQPHLRVLVVAPGALLSQWFLELHVRFGERPFRLLDRERLRAYPGNPWKDEPFLIASHHVLEDLDATGALRLAQSRWDLVVVDECHRMRPSGVLYRRIAQLSRHTPSVLLLSATPSRSHADAYLALLALLEPQVYRLEDLAGFQARLAAHGEIVELLAETLGAAPEALAACGDRWAALLAEDASAVALAQALAREGSAAARDALVAHVREHHRLDARIIRHRRRLLTRIQEATGSPPVAASRRTHERIPVRPDANELQLRALLVQYRALLGADRQGLPPRLAHWLVQLELAIEAHPRVLDRLLRMRAQVLEDPAAVAEYRDRVQEGETLAEVLRADLSEEETLAHIATSAACHADRGEAEGPLIEQLRALLPRARTPAKVRALAERLQRFWRDNPGEKVLVFTTQPLAVEPLTEALAHAVGEGAVQAFGAFQSTEAREDAARTFATNPDCWVLVSDPLGGEGRNFQFVSVVVHYDLPWSVAAVEQRIGRVDRIGRDGEVPSWVLVADDPSALLAGWAEVLERAVAVFTTPASGLEFIAERIEGEALTAALAGGREGLAQALPTLTALVAQERSGAEAREDELFQREVSVYTEAAGRAQAIATAEPPVDAVGRWLRHLGGGLRWAEEDGRICQVRTRHGDRPNQGTFMRDLALARPALAFLAVGHGLIDRVLDDAASAAWLAAQAWRRPLPRGGTPWKGVVAVVALSYDLAALAAAGAPLSAARRLLIDAPPSRVTLAARADGTLEQDPAVLALVTRPFDARSGDAALSAGSSRELWARLLAQGQLAQVLGWQEEIDRAGTAIRAEADRRLAQLRDPAVARLRQRLDASVANAQAQAQLCRRRLGAGHADTIAATAAAEEETRQAGALLAALQGARLVLQACSYLAVG